MGAPGDKPPIRWDVTADMIDLDLWAKVHVDLLRTEATESATRWGIWPIWVIFAAVVVVTAITDPVLTVVPLAIGGLAFVLVVVWNRGQEQRLAQQLHQLPAASEPFTIVADATGTHRRGTSGSDDLPWRRYRSVALRDGLVVLTLDNGVHVPLPTEGLVDTAPAEAVRRIEGWLATASTG